MSAIAIRNEDGAIKKLARGVVRYISNDLQLRGRGQLVKYLAPVLIPGNGWINGYIGELPFQFDLNNQLERGMYYGLYECEFIRFLEKVVGQDKVVIDVGANIGYVTARMAALVGKNGAVHSFEPVTFLYERLKWLSEEASKVGYKITPNKSALSNMEGYSEIQINKVNQEWNSIIPGVLPENLVASTEKIALTTFSKYLLDAHINPKDITLVKIDVEGAEPLVLQGMKDFFEAGFRPMIVCEINPEAWPLIGVDPGEVYSMMQEQYGYKMFLFQRKRIVPGDGLQLKINGANAVWIHS